LVGRTVSGKNFRIFGARNIGVVVETQILDIIEKRMFHSKLSKDQVWFLHKSDT
jgi:hypothetical protein